MVKAKKQFEKDKAHFCSWKDCVAYHRKKSPAVLQVCRGCGQAWYCGRECQRSDWKGGHKEDCRRLKNEK
ncbi:hypothetical protein OF83DRAFT_1098556 [Amylostereum chailletii]|nr:hypothetical protein OF83DRAFT_1098556 [Amylostereum chailletii]